MCAENTLSCEVSCYLCVCRALSRSGDPEKLLDLAPDPRQPSERKWPPSLEGVHRSAQKSLCQPSIVVEKVWGCYLTGGCTIPGEIVWMVMRICLISQPQHGSARSQLSFPDMQIMQQKRKQTVPSNPAPKSVPSCLSS